MQNMIASTSASIVGGSIKDAINNDPSKKSVEDLLLDIHILFVETATWLKLQQSVSVDIFKFYQVYKIGQGPAFSPVHLGDRIHYAVLAGAATVLNVTAPGLGTFNINLVPGVWFTIDFPDNTTYTLDAGNANNSVLLWTRNTNQAIT